VGLPTTINVERRWFDTLQVDPAEFSTRIDDFTVMGNPEHGVGYGSFAALSANRQIVFYSYWVPNVPSAGSAFALEYVDDVPTTLHYSPIEGATHSWVVDNGNRSRSVVFMGVDEGKIPSNNFRADSPSYTFDLDSRQWATLDFRSTSHNSIPLDYDEDGDEDIVSQAWHDPFDDGFFILRNNGGTFEPLRMGNSGSEDVDGMSVAPLGFQDDGNFLLFVGDGNSRQEFAIGGETNYILAFSPGLDDVVAAHPVPPAYFEAPIFDSVDMVIPEWDGTVGHSHDISAKALDLDYDADLDLIVSSMIWSDSQPYTVLQFLINEDGTYRDDTDSRLYNWLLTGPGHHRLDFLDVNGDGFVDILTSDHGSALWQDPQVDESMTTGSRVLVNDGTGHFVTVIHQQISDGHGFRPSFIPSINANNQLRWTSFDPRGAPTFDVVTRMLDMELSTGPNMTDPASSGAPGFNEFYYLLHNSDVAEGVEDGVFRSGLEHYLTIGKSEGRRAFAPGAVVTE
jgi:hypothetical protein